MNHPSPGLASANLVEPSAITRREAIRRAALFLGVALSPSLLSNALEAQSAAAPAGKVVRFLSDSQRALVTVIVERILPKTDTPGAIDAGVPDFIDVIYGKYLSADDRTLFSAGLDEIAAKARKLHGKALTALAPGEQDALLMEAAREAQPLPKSFFFQIKELTVVGYFTSELVGKTVLKYDPVPGRFDPCIPLAEVGNVQWTR